MDRKFYNEVKNVLDLLISGEYSSLEDVLKFVGMNDRTYKKYLHKYTDLHEIYLQTDWKNIFDIRCSCCKTKLTSLNYRNFDGIQSLGGASPNKFRKCDLCFNNTIKTSRNNLNFKLEQLFRSSKSRATNENIPFNIDKDFLFQLWNTQSGKCKWTNDLMTFESRKPNTVSLDRINSNKGYTKDNICLCTWEVNWTKRNLSIEQLKVICQKIIANN